MASVAPWGVARYAASASMVAQDILNDLAATAASGHAAHYTPPHPTRPSPPTLPYAERRSAPAREEGAPGGGGAPEHGRTPIGRVLAPPAPSRAAAEAQEAADWLSKMIAGTGPPTATAHAKGTMGGASSSEGSSALTQVATDADADPTRDAAVSPSSVSGLQLSAAPGAAPSDAGNGEVKAAKGAKGAKAKERPIKEAVPKDPSALRASELWEPWTQAEDEQLLEAVAQRGLRVSFFASPTLYARANPLLPRVLSPMNSRTDRTRAFVPYPFVPGMGRHRARSL